MSTFKIEVVPIILEPHPNADKLSIVHIKNYQVVVKTEDWLDKNMGIYIPPDSVVPNISAFKFLFKPSDPVAATYRIRVKKFRGCVSMGLLIPVPPLYSLPQTNILNTPNFASVYGITHYETPIEINTNGETGKSPNLHIPIYDIENWYNYPNIFKDSEPIVITEKLHGAQGRWLYHNEEYYAGSKREWKKEGNNIWWRALNENNNLKSFLKIVPGTVVYGEVYGDVQDLKYEHMKGQISIRIFDIYDTLMPMFFNQKNIEEFAQEFHLSLVPIIQHTVYSSEKLQAEGISYLGNHIREGIVIKPMIERFDNTIGRVILKKVSNDYLER